jgi:Fic family protein
MLYNKFLYLLLEYILRNMNYKIPNLPLGFDVETKSVLKQTIEANRRLAELKGVVKSMPNASILINTLALQEAKDSSAIESIITTHDELYKAELFVQQFTSAGAGSANLCRCIKTVI